MHLFPILKTLIRLQSKYIYILIYFSDIAWIRIFKNGALINEVKEQNINLGMSNRNDAAPNDSIYKINPNTDRDINNEILKNQEEKFEENSNEEINLQYKI